MRLKTYTAKTMKEVMARVREELGPDAIIVNIDQGKRVGGVRVTAAFEGEVRPSRAPQTPNPAPSPAAAFPADQPLSAPARPARSRLPFDMADLTAVMSHQGIPHDMAMRLQTAATSMQAESLPDALSAALETCFTFHPLATESERPMMLVGPPGAGKTVAAAKLAVEATVNERRVRLISTDTVKSTGIEQLEHFAHLMKLGVEAASSPEELEMLVSPSRGGQLYCDLLLIDTPGVNPFNVEELEQMAIAIKISGAEPVLVLPAGMDPMEAADIAEIFASMGARRMIATRLDTARRYASILTAAQSGRLAISGIGRSPYVAQNIETATPLAFARIIAALPKSRNRDKTQKRVTR